MTKTETKTMNNVIALPIPETDTESEGSVTEDEKRHAFGTIIRARLSTDSLVTIKAQTGENYHKKSILMNAQLDKLHGSIDEKWEQILTPYAPVSGSFFAMRAAAAWSIKQQISGLLTEQDAMQRLGQRSQQWLYVAHEIDNSLEELACVESIERMELLDMAGLDPVRSKSLRKSLKRLPEGWRDHFVEHAQRSERYAHEICILAATGCRPSELARGVHLTLDFDRVVARITGTKVSEHAGQPWREMGISLSSITPGLLRELQDRGQMSVGIWSTAGLRSRIADWSHQLWTFKPAMRRH